MKFKFSEEVQKVIDELAVLPPKVDSIEMTRLPMKLIGTFEKELIKGWNEKKIPMKQWAKLRRQLSFLYEIIYFAEKLFTNKLAKEVIQCISKGQTFTDPDESKKPFMMYEITTAFARDLKNGNLLKEAPIVRIAMRYGIIHLSDHEIEGLIERNKV